MRAVPYMDRKSWKVYGSVMILGTTDTYMQRSACQWWSVLHGHFAFTSPCTCTQTASRTSRCHNVTGFFKTNTLLRQCFSLSHRSDFSGAATIAECLLILSRASAWREVVSQSVVAPLSTKVEASLSPFSFSMQLHVTL